MHRKYSSQYEDNVVSRKSVFFRGSRRSKVAEMYNIKRRRGAPSTSTTKDNIQQVRVMSDRHQVASSLNVSHGSANQIIHDKLGLRKVCTR